MDNAKAISMFNYAAHNATAGRDFYAGKVRSIYAETRPVAPVADEAVKAPKAPRKPRKA